MFEFIKNWFKKPQQNRIPINIHRRRRQSIQELTFGPVITAPPDAENVWRLNSLDVRTLEAYPVDQLIELLIDLSPEISRALFDFIRMVNPSHEVLVTRVGGEKQYNKAQVTVDGFFRTLDSLYGTRNVVINRLILASFLRGAFFAEIVLDDQFNGVDLAVPDPFTARFRKIADPIRGEVWQLGQYQLSGFVPLDYPTIRYIPIDPLPNSPYGRPLVSPAVFTALFMLGLLHDLRRVVAQQGYPRIDLALDLERLKLIMPANLEGSDQLKEWVDAIITEIELAYETLEPDDAYVHSDVVSVNNSVGTLDSSSLGAVDGLIQALERFLTRALKTMPLLMGLSDTAGETFANRQWEIFVGNIKSIQELLEALLNNLLGQMLRAQGIQAEVHFKFGELRATEELKDAQTESIKITNAKEKRDQGWITQDEASLEIVGHQAVAEAPSFDMFGEEDDLGDDDGDGDEQDEDLQDREERAGLVAFGRILEKWGKNGKHQ